MRLGLKFNNNGGFVIRRSAIITQLVIISRPPESIIIYVFKAISEYQVLLVRYAFGGSVSKLGVYVSSDSRQL